jgi:L-fuconolactonase
MSVIRKDLLLEDLILILQDNEITGWVDIQAAPSEKEIQFLLDFARIHDFNIGVIDSVDFTKSDVLERLAYSTKDLNFKGVLHLLQAKPAGFIIQRI